jgi:hypothetical protein
MMLRVALVAIIPQRMRGLIRSAKQAAKFRSVRNREYPIAIETVVNSYPKFYSERRFHDWAGLFDTNAIVCGVRNDGRITVKRIHESRRDQEGFAARYHTLTEEWANVRTHQFGSFAVVIADYILQADEHHRSGTDVLLLVQDFSGWRILALAYHEHERR